MMSKSKKVEQLEKFVRDDPVNALKDVGRILGCEMRPTVGDDNDASKQIFLKHYLVKWNGLSYLHCTWVLEKDFINVYKELPHLRTKVIDFNKRMLRYNSLGSEGVPFWQRKAMVERILACRQGEEEKEYLVKWAMFDYHECNWESESDISSFQQQIECFNRLQSRYQKRRMQKSNKHDVPGAQKKLKEFQQFKKSPKFLYGGKLRAYQLERLNFLRSSWSKQTHVILANDMNRGKEVESIAFQASLYEENVGPHLVVTPRITLGSWKREFDTWAPHMNVVRYVGPDAAVAVIRENEFYFPESYGMSKQERIKFDVLLTSDEMINKDDGWLKSVHWETMIMDECQHLKNKNPKLFPSLKQFDTRHHTLLIRTPLQSLDELFMPLHFLDAKKFASLEKFQEEFRDINQEEQVSKLNNMMFPHLQRNFDVKSFHSFAEPLCKDRRFSPFPQDRHLLLQPPDLDVKNFAEPLSKDRRFLLLPQDHHLLFQPPGTSMASESGQSKMTFRPSVTKVEMDAQAVRARERKRKAKAKEATSSNPVAAAAVHHFPRPDTPFFKKKKVSEGGAVIPETRLPPGEQVVDLEASPRSFLTTDKVNEILLEVERLLPRSENCIKGTTNDGLGTELVSDLLHGLQTALVVRRQFQDHAHAIAARKTAEAKLSEALEQLKKANGVEAKLAASERELVKTQMELKTVREEKKVALEEMVSLKARHAKEEVKLSNALAQLKKAKGVGARLVASERELVKTRWELKRVEEEKKVALEEVMSSHVMIEGLDRNVEKLTKELEESEKMVRTLGEEDEVEAYVVIRTCTGLMKQVLDGRSPNLKRREVVDRFAALMGDSDAG